MKRIYIAGKVTGEDRETCTAKFAKAQEEIEAMGHMVLNPIELVGGWNTPWQLAMKICICHLMTADTVVLLSDWHKSKGAKIEKQLADDLQIPTLNYTKDGLQILKYQLADETV